MSEDTKTKQEEVAGTSPADRGLEKKISAFGLITISKCGKFYIPLVLETPRTEEMKKNPKWKFPGGNVFAGNTPVDFVIRRVAVETGIVVGPFVNPEAFFIKETVSDKNWHEFQVFHFHASPEYEPVAGGGIQEVVLRTTSEIFELIKERKFLDNHMEAFTTFISKVVNGLAKD